MAEGKGLTEVADKGDFVKALLACINDMAEEIESLEEYVHELTEYAEAIDEDLGDVEDLMFDDWDDDDVDFDDDDIFVEPECSAQTATQLLPSSARTMTTKKWKMTRSSLRMNWTKTDMVADVLVL